MSETLSTKASEVSDSNSSSAAESDKITSIRVSPNSYFTALFLTTFTGGFLVYLEYDLAALVVLAGGFSVLPFLAWTDRIEFDGKRLTRTGFLPRFRAWLNASRCRLKISDIEQVESQSLRALKRGGNVFYRYRTIVRGKDSRFAFASGGEDYRQMIHRIFPLLNENILDNRSIELRDYLSEPKETLMKAAFAHIPSAEVLESTFKDFQTADKNPNAKSNAETISEDRLEQSEYLHRLANELRLSGYLLQSLEAFRRALVLNPKNAWLIFDFARCLHSFAGSEKDARLRRKAFAALRLAERRGKNDSEFLARLGESYFQYGDWRRASEAFERAGEIAETNFRSVRGLAEIALREGKIAYVIMHFAAANRIAETPALRRWTRGENEYFSRLNADEDYMDMEISRVNLLETFENSRKTCLKIALVGFPVIIFGLLNDELIANVGWAISCVSLTIWVVLIFLQNMFSARIPLDFEEDDE